MSLNIARLIAERTVTDRDRPALIHGESIWTFGDLLARADAVAARLKVTLAENCGEASVPRVGLFCPNSPEYVALALGILQAGACFVPIAPELAIREREAQIDLTAQHLVIASGADWPPAASAHPEETGQIQWRWTARKPDAQFPEERFAALAPAFIRFSSGTTGSSKGAMLSHQTLLDRVTSANRRLQISADDRVLWTLPMAHHFAVSIVLYLLNGATTVIEDSHLASDILTTARRTGATVIYGSPFHHALLAAEESGADWPTLRVAVSTAASLNLDVANAFHHRYGVPLSQALGVIEAGLPLLNTSAAAAKPLSVGRPDDIEVRLRTEDGGEAEAGEIGEICLRGPGFFDAYLLPWSDRDEVLQEGWFATGDLGTRDEDGHIYLKGRSKSVINVGGMKFFPEEVESVLNSHPGVASSRVVAEPHDRFQMIPVAEIVPRDLANPPASPALTRHCRERLAGYKVPLRFRFVNELPKTASGKIKR